VDSETSSCHRIYSPACGIESLTVAWKPAGWVVSRWPGKASLEFDTLQGRGGGVLEDEPIFSGIDAAKAWADQKVAEYVAR
jgi:hypothetical protein